VGTNASFLDKLPSIRELMEGLVDSHAGSQQIDTAKPKIGQDFVTLPEVVPSGFSVQDLMNDPLDNLSTQPRLDPYHDCMPCVHNVSVHILNSVEEWAHDKCAQAQNSTCEYIKRVCHWIDTHPKIFAGYVVGRLRTHVLGYAYCAGKGLCDPHPHHPNSTYSGYSGDSSAPGIKDSIEDDVSGAAKMIEQAMKHLVHDKEGDQKSNQNENEYEDKLDLFSSDDHFENDDDEDEDDSETDDKWNVVDSLLKQAGALDDSFGKPLLGRNGAGLHDPKGHHHCVKCYKKQVRKQLCHAVKKVKQFCEHTKCPFMKKKCAWIIKEENKPYLVGFLMAVKRVNLYAAGYCRGAGKCHKHQSRKAKHWITFPFESL